jgi:hypothetical protein
MSYFDIVKQLRFQTDLQKQDSFLFEIGLKKIVETEHRT